MTTQHEPEAGTQSRWQFDPYHTQVEFSAKHLGMMTVRGHFTEINATGNIYPDRSEASAVDVTMQTASIRTHNENRDNDLRSSNFLEVDKYPTINFKSTEIKPAGEDRYTMLGDLTIKDNTRPLTLNDGKIVSGLFLREEGAVLVLADQQGKEVRVQKDQVDQRTTLQLSPMPANFGEQIMEADLVHLLGYLLEQRVKN